MVQFCSRSVGSTISFSPTPSPPFASVVAELVDAATAVADASESVAAVAELVVVGEVGVAAAV